MIKSFKTKCAILSSVFLLSSFEVFGSDIPAAAKNPAEAKYQALLTAGDYDQLTAFLDQMVQRMTSQLDKAQQVEEGLKQDEFADEMELENAHQDTVNKQFALKFWKDRLVAVDSLRNAATEDRKRIEQVNSILPKLVEVSGKALQERHEANSAYGELASFVKENKAFLQSVEGLGALPEITLDMGVKQALQDGKIAALQKSVEAYLLKMKEEAAAREAAGKDAATSVARSSNSKEKAKAKAAAKSGAAAPAA